MQPHKSIASFSPHESLFDRPKHSVNGYLPNTLQHMKKKLTDALFLYSNGGEERLVMSTLYCFERY